MLSELLVGHHCEWLIVRYNPDSLLVSIVPIRLPYASVNISKLSAFGESRIWAVKYVVKVSRALPYPAIGMKAYHPLMSCL